MDVYAGYGNAIVPFNVYMVNIVSMFYNM